MKYFRIILFGFLFISSSIIAQSGKIIFDDGSELEITEIKDWTGAIEGQFSGGALNCYVCYEGIWEKLEWSDIKSFEIISFNYSVHSNWEFSCMANVKVKIQTRSGYESVCTYKQIWSFDFRYISKITNKIAVLHYIPQTGTAALKKIVFN